VNGNRFSSSLGLPHLPLRRYASQLAALPSESGQEDRSTLFRSVVLRVESGIRPLDRLFPPTQQLEPTDGFLPFLLLFDQRQFLSSGITQFVHTGSSGKGVPARRAILAQDSGSLTCLTLSSKRIDNLSCLTLQFPEPSFIIS